MAAKRGKIEGKSAAFYLFSTKSLGFYFEVNHCTIYEMTEKGSTCISFDELQVPLRI